jgi:hypothetical protein
MNDVNPNLLCSILNKVLANSQIFTLFHEIFFLPVWTAKNAQNSHSWAFSNKSFVLKTIHVTSSYRKNKRFFYEKAHERLFWALFTVHTGEKKISWKSVKMCEYFLWIHANSREKVGNFVNSREFAWKKWIWQHCKFSSILDPDWA